MVIHVEIESFMTDLALNVGYRIYDYYEVVKKCLLLEVRSQQEICLDLGKQEYHLGNNYGI